LTKYIVSAMLIWLLIVGTSLSWNLVDDQREWRDAALHTGRTFFRQILLDRAWNAGHSGVYVPISRDVKPNPYLIDVPFRDVVTTGGLHLTMVNPAYMTRQIAEMAAREKEGLQFHTTSLRPIRPANKATEWEAAWLASFEKGAKEQYAFLPEGRGGKFRYMAPLFIKPECLECHGKQGYKEGDIRGGISITMPLPVLPVNWPLWISHGVAALAGLAGILVTGILLIRSRKTMIEANAVLKREVAERRRSEEQLSKFKYIVSASEEHMAFIGLDHQCQAVNNACLAAYGKDREQVVGHGTTALFGEDIVAATIREPLTRAFAGEHVRHQAWLDLPARGSRYMEIAYCPYRGDEKHILGVVINARDITEHKQAGDELRQAEHDWDHTFNSISDFVSVHDTEYRFIKVNQALADFFGMERKDFIGRHCYEIFHGTNEPWPGCPHTKTIAHHGPGTAEIDDPKIGCPLQVTTSPIYGNNGEFKGSIHIAKDISAVKRKEEERLQLQDQFFFAQKMESVGRLASGVAHDFNNLLTVILSYSELAILELPAGASVQRYIEIIKESSRKAAMLTRQLLAFSRKQALAMHVINLNAVIGGMGEILDRLLGDNILLEIKLTHAASTIRADAGQMEQILMNLVVNACDAMPNGGGLAIETSVVSLTEEYVRVHDEVKPGVYVLLTVSDQGTGITREVRKKMFDPFFTTKGVGKGTGLGLATVYGIVRQHGGHIDVESTVGKGTTFKLYFQVCTDTETGKESRENLNMPGGTETILVAEDADDIRQLVVDVLEPLGYNLIEAADGMEALELSRSGHTSIDLLLTDILMPRMNGTSLADNLKAARPDIKVIFMSGGTDEAINRHQILARGDVLLQKPLMPAQLASMVREVLDARRSVKIQ